MIPIINNVTFHIKGIIVQQKRSNPLMYYGRRVVPRVIEILKIQCLRPNPDLTSYW